MLKLFMYYMVYNHSKFNSKPKGLKSIHIFFIH
jgi:hypothetical protein